MKQRSLVERKNSCRSVWLPFDSGSCWDDCFSFLLTSFQHYLIVPPLRRIITSWSEIPKDQTENVSNGRRERRIWLRREYLIGHMATASRDQERICPKQSLSQRIPFLMKTKDHWFILIPIRYSSMRRSLNTRRLYPSLRVLMNKNHDLTDHNFQVIIPSAIADKAKGKWARAPSVKGKNT
jgi:hypothetical protein